MLKTGILHPQLNRLLSELGHTDRIVIADAGLPIPLGVERVDLAWKANEPEIIPVLEQILKHTAVQKIILAEEIKDLGSKEVYEQILGLAKDIPVEYIPHVEFKKACCNVRGIIRTGEFSPYPNIILESGCAF